ncbi:hypothetical protein BP6252_03224 [Coleophoma cylindrospora]|uniref:Stc1 domain-containing protein n=1 Tax=Coleophoma cylindrospora TaxID=1849047 RepID=A0A3D8S738_9HELO|nr:hypothetical protein BP6252_03224 [Coleophoma cylindrospora]
MPPNNQKFTDMSSTGRKNIPLLKECNKRKDPHSFSQKEINAYLYKVSTGIRLNAITAKMCCRTCKGEQVHEMECEGPCGLVKVLDDFSKAQRYTGSRWCKACVNWKEAAEPGVVPVAAPNNDLAPDEEFEYFGSREGTHDPEAGYDSDEDYGMPYGTMNTMVIGATPQQQQAFLNTATSVPTNGLTTMSANGGHDNRSTHSGSVADSSTASNPYAGRLNAATASVSSWSAADPRRASATGREYRAWDSSGQYVTRHQDVSSTHETNSNVGKDKDSQWFPASRLPLQDAATSSVTAASLVASSRASMAPSVPDARAASSWARPAGRKTAKPKGVVRSPYAPIEQAPRAGDNSDDDYM